ncbi:MAG: NADH-FMN oxidoreductase, partial [uncultured Rubrobacteraceae bacterium]
AAQRPKHSRRGLLSLEGARGGRRRLEERDGPLPDRCDGRHQRSRGAGRGDDGERRGLGLPRTPALPRERPPRRPPERPHKRGGPLRREPARRRPGGPLAALRLPRTLQRPAGRKLSGRRLRLDGRPARRGRPGGHRVRAGRDLRRRRPRPLSRPRRRREARRHEKGPPGLPRGRLPVPRPRGWPRRYRSLHGLRQGLRRPHRPPPPPL